MYKLPQNDNLYEWTNHGKNKMVYYGVSENRIKRIIRHPQRIEEGVAENTIAAMQPAGTKKYQEIWVMYQTKFKAKSLKLKGSERKNSGKIRIISVWRYPGKSPKRNPIPKSILSELSDELTIA